MATNPLVNIFRTQELRQRIIFTIFLLIIFRLGAVIPLPGVDFIELKRSLNTQSTHGGVNILDYLDLFVGGAFKNYSIFMLGIMPYITCSIVMQLLVVVFPRLKKISEEEGGRKKIQKYTRYATVFVAAVQSLFLISSTVKDSILTKPRGSFLFLGVVTVATGTMFLMWMGEQINQRGIGNGISLLIFAGIVARIPNALLQLGIIKSLLRFIEDVGVTTGLTRRGDILSPAAQSSTGINPVFILMALVMFVFVVTLIIYEQRGQRKIPVHYAKRVVGRRMYGAQNTYLPFKLNPSGVIPIIFANTILITPIQIISSVGSNIKFFRDLARFLNPYGVPYLILYSLLIVFFAYFYTQVTLNPIEISKNIREHGGSIPGIRSERMEQYLIRILNRIILPGSLFLAFIAVIPSIITKLFGFPWSVARIMGGTSLIILVGVGLDTMSQIEGHLRMHHHEGLVKKGKIKARNL
ncbi:MAG: preprotein translocase subunit SecY [Spirochaetia bacterium]